MSYGFDNVYEELSVANVLSKVSDSVLWRYYFGEFELKKNYSSPLRKDDTPSFNLFEDKRGRVMFKDFGGGLYGDVFEFLQKRDVLSFREALVRVNVDFRLGLGNPHEQSYTGYVPISTKVERQLERFEENFKIQTTAVFNAYRRQWAKGDFDHWMQYGITKPTLEDYDVHCIKRVLVNGQLKYEQTRNNPCYGYYFRVSKHIKCYFPFSSTVRFFGNTNNYQDIQGYYQCRIKERRHNLLILTKSMKDCMCLRELGYDAMSIHGEGHLFLPDFIRHLKKYYPRIVSLYDRDKQGVKGAKYLWKNYRIPAYFVPKFLTRAKDISDVYKEYGREKAEEIMNRIVSDVSLIGLQ